VLYQSVCVNDTQEKKTQAQSGKNQRHDAQRQVKIVKIENRITRKLRNSSTERSTTVKEENRRQQPVRGLG
jgi:hypothetical protein